MVRRVLLLLVGVGALAAALIEVDVSETRVHVRWRDEVPAAERSALEQRFSLADGEKLDDSTWRYALGDRSPANLRALVEHNAVADTAYIDRTSFAVPPRRVDVGTRLDSLLGPVPSTLVQPQSIVLVAAGATLLWAASVPDRRRRRALAATVLAGVGFTAYLVPLDQDIAMGDSETYTRSREDFEFYAGVRQVRYEAHLSHVIFARLDSVLGRTDTSPARALEIMMHGATAWLLAMLAGVAFVHAWSSVAVRYLALALISPSALLYFGYRELGHLSLNAAVFPLLVRGLRDGTRQLEVTGGLAGFGAALHGFGLISIAGCVLGIVGAAVSRGRRFLALLRFVPWSIALHVGWVALYVIVLKLPVIPGHAESIPLRPLLIDEQVGERLNVAFVSSRGVRDVIATVLVTGMPLIAVAASLRPRIPFDGRLALLYAIPSVVFALAFWPIQGLAVEMDLLMAAFPAIYALAWVCAHDQRHAVAAAVILIFGHLVFWRVALDPAFVNSRM